MSATCRYQLNNRDFTILGYREKIRFSTGKFSNLDYRDYDPKIKFSSFFEWRT